MTTPRSYLFIPGDAERKLAKAADAGTDAVIYDLEDSVDPARKNIARDLVKAALRAPAGSMMRLVRINPLDSGLACADLVAVLPAGPDAIMLPKAEGLADIIRLGHYLDALEAAFGLAADTVGIVPVATETPAAMLALPSMGAGHKRLRGIAWGAEDLATALGASANRDQTGAFTAPYRAVRTQCLLVAAAAGVAPIETLHGDYRDAAGLAAAAAAAARDGFGGMLAIHPAQCGPINQAFTPGPDAIAHARAVLAAFAASPGAGVVGLAGRMLDRPHLLQAQRLLARAPAFRP